MSTMNWVDFLFLAIFIFSAIVGFSRGFVREVISVATWICAFIVATLFSSHLAAIFTGSAQVQSVVSSASSALGANASQPFSYAALGISFFLLFVGTLLAGSLVNLIFSSLVAVSGLSIINRILGGGFGLARGFIMSVVIMFLVQLTPLGGQGFWRQSQFVNAFQPSVLWLGGVVAPGIASIRAKLSQTIQGVGSQIQNVTGSF